MKKALLFRLAVLVAAMMCALGAAADEAYACYTSSNTTLTFYYDNYRSSRTGTTYDLNANNTSPVWRNDGTYASVTKVVFDQSFIDARPTTTYRWFSRMENLESITNIEYLNTSEVTDMRNMFEYCCKLSTIDLSHFNTAKATNMNFMFSDCSALTNLDAYYLNTENVTEMRSMFSGCSALTDLYLYNFNTANVRVMSNMFNGCENLTSIYVDSTWSAAAATGSIYMFNNCTKLLGARGTAYDPEHVNKEYARIDGGPSEPGYFTEYKGREGYACYMPDGTLTFYCDNARTRRYLMGGTTFDLNTGSNFPDWFIYGTSANVKRVVFSSSFADYYPSSTFCWFWMMKNLEVVTGMEYLNTSEVTDMTGMFYYCSNLTAVNLRHFNTSKVTSMLGMFGFTGLTSLDLTSFDTHNVTDMGRMFNYSELNTIYVGNGWSTASVTNSEDMFYGCINLVGGQGTTYDSNHNDASYAHIDGDPSNPGYFTAVQAYACYTSSNTTLTFYYDTQRSSRTGTTYDLNTGINDAGWDSDGTRSNVTKVVFDPSFADARPTTTYDWFYGMQKLESITGMEYLNTSEVTNMSWMFTNCKKLTSLDLSHFNTSKVTNMNSMFGACWGLTSLDFSSFNTSKVTNMNSMFGACTNLRTIYVGSGWSTATVTTSDQMFNGCNSLVGGQGTTYNDSNPMDKTYAHIDGGPSNPGYFTAKNAGLRGDVNGDGSVNISDVTALIDYLLTGNASGISLSGADCNQDGNINISDVAALIDRLLIGSW